MAIEPDREPGRFRWTIGEPEPVVAAFHAVRQLTYASTGSRDPVDLVQNRRGACTVKHLLLRQLLASLDVPCRVETVAGHFGLGLPADAPDMSEELRDMIRAGGVRDFHNVVRARVEDETVLLDATWHDAMIPVGFPVNHAWEGRGSTVVAIEGEVLEDEGNDPVRFKTQLIAALPAAEKARRLRFLDLITQYSATR